MPDLASSSSPALPREAAHRPQRLSPPPPFLLDPEIAEVMDAIKAWVRALLPDVGPEHGFDENLVWEISWRAREISLVTGRAPLSDEGAFVHLAFAWWQLDCESGDEFTRWWSDLAA